MSSLNAADRPVDATGEGGMLLGRRVIEFRRPAAYATIAGLVSLGVLAAAFVTYLRGRPVPAAFVAAGSALLAYVLLRPLLSARLIVYQNGMDMTDGRRHQRVLWEDVADIRPTHSANLVIRARSGGGMVLREDWHPRREYRALLERLRRWTEP